MEPPIVAGAAASVVIDEDVSARLHAGAFVVYLRAKIETLVDRVTGTYRPWLGTDPALTLRTLYKGREPRYEQLAHLIVDVDHTTPDDVARRVLDAATTTK